MVKNLSLYPSLKKWGIRTTDTNIDHRRVPNLEVFFERKGRALAVTKNAGDYKTGELATWIINEKLSHIGTITNKKTRWKATDDCS